jgi:hypothetical protein
MHRPMRRTRSFLPCVALAALALTACGSSTSTPAPVLTSVKTTLFPVGTTGLIEARTSMIPADGTAPILTFDDVTLASSATISAVAWQGIYCTPQNNSGAPAPTATGFTIAFYPDSAGRPKLSAPVQTSSVTLAQSAQTFDHNIVNLNCDFATGTTWAAYNYAATLATPVALTAGTKYWFSVQANVPTAAANFAWRNGTVDDSLSLQERLGVYSTSTFDRSYSLSALK